MGPDVVLVSSADETAFAVRGCSASSACCARHAAPGEHRFLSSGDVSWFGELGRRLLGPELARAEQGTPGADEPVGDSGAVTARRRSLTCPAPTAAADELRPITFERDYTEMAAGSCSSPSGAPGAVHGVVDDDVPRWMRGSGKGWVTAEYSMLPGSSPERVDREAARQAERPHPGDPAPHRPGAAGGLRSRGARRAPGHRRLRRAAGRRRHPHRRICGGYLALHDALARLVQPGGYGPSAALVLRRDQCRHRRRRARARPPLRRGQPGRGRHERGDVRPIAGGAASSRSRAPPRGRRSADPSSTTLLALAEVGIAEMVDLQTEMIAAAASALGGATGAAGSPRRSLVCASANPDKVAEIAAVLGDVSTFAAPAEVARRGRGCRHPGRQRSSQGGCVCGRRPARRWRTTPASRSPPSAAARRPRRPLRGPGASDEENWSKLMRAERAGVPGGARFRTSPWWGGRTAMSCSPRCEPTARSSLDDAAELEFGYDPVRAFDGDGRTFAEMIGAEKQAISHQACSAFGLFRMLLGSTFGGR